MNIFSLLGYPFHVISCSRFVLYPRLFVYVVSFSLTADCVEPLAYGFLVLITLYRSDPFIFLLSLQTLVNVQSK
jgi:hypothetical protein